MHEVTATASSGRYDIGIIDCWDISNNWCRYHGIKSNSQLFLTGGIFLITNCNNYSYTETRLTGQIFSFIGSPVKRNIYTFCKTFGM